MGIRKGFTLAEVLITLVIIGVIAAMTIPSLMNKTNEQDTVVAVKRAYSLLCQAYNKLKAENGEVNLSYLGGGSDTENTLAFGDLLSKQFSVLQNCKMNAGEECFAEGTYKNFDGRDWYAWNADTTHYKLRLSDGMSVGMHLFDSYQNFGTSDVLQSVFGFIDVDVNGNKAPNTAGKDTFVFWITKYGIFPAGMPDDTFRGFSDCRTLGYGCTAWVLTKGNVDYWNKDVSW